MVSSPMKNSVVPTPTPPAKPQGIGQGAARTDPSPNGSNSSSFCRICHDGDGAESLLAPCRCTGTVALIHASCLERWLTSSNTGSCEICKHPFPTAREPRSCTEYLEDSANQFNLRNLVADLICFLLLTPLLVVSTYLCIVGAQQYFARDRWEAVGLLLLAIFLLGVYCTWCHVTTKFHMSVWLAWQQTNQRVRLTEVLQSRVRSPLVRPSATSSNPTHLQCDGHQADPEIPDEPEEVRTEDTDDTSRILL